MNGATFKNNLNMGGKRKITGGVGDLNVVWSKEFSYITIKLF